MNSDIYYLFDLYNRYLFKKDITLFEKYYETIPLEYRVLIVDRFRKLENDVKTNHRLLYDYVQDYKSQLSHKQIDIVSPDSFDTDTIQCITKLENMYKKFNINVIDRDNIYIKGVISRIHKVLNRITFLTYYLSYIFEFSNGFKKVIIDNFLVANW